MSRPLAVPLAAGLVACAFTGPHATPLPPVIVQAAATDARSPASSVDAAIIGFAPGRAADQRALEAKLDQALTASNLRTWMRELTAHPHPVGSPHGKKNAETMAELFRSWGYEASVEEFEILFPTPAEIRVELVAPHRSRARMAEPSVRGDLTSTQRSEILPPYNAFSVDGDVTADLVYVNYGVQADYDRLEQLGVDVKGKLIIARYGMAWRGIKPKLAAEKGAIGCIMYSDPRDDGYYQGDVYPVGAFRPEHGVQRGAVMDLPLRPGDPLTPFVGATPDAKRISRKNAETLTRVPVVPISYADAEPLLRALGGPVAPPSWRGALPLTYHVGPGPARVRLAASFDWNMVTARNVIARLPGSELPDEWVVRGNHHDAWVSGASDPVSGLVALMEEARAIASLTQNGWKPRRTLVYAAWDADEPGLIGSTEWVEHHAEELGAKAVAYVNSDSNGRGFLRMQGSHSYAPFLNQVAREVIDPQTGLTVLERLRSRLLTGHDAEAKKKAGTEDVPIGALGSGSDYSPFLQHLGIPAMNLGFGGENAGGSYHSTYDSFEHYTRFGDLGFVYGVTQARVTGRVMLRIAQADVVPNRFVPFVATVETYVTEIVKLTEELRKQTAETNRLLDQGRFRAAADPTKPFAPPRREAPVPHVNLAPLHNAVAQLRTSAEAFDAALAHALTSGATLDSAAVDRAIVDAERSLAPPRGLPGRPWYRHQIYAPGFYTGYGVKTLPAVREAIEARDWFNVDDHTSDLAKTLLDMARKVDAARALVPAPAD